MIYPPTFVAQKIHQEIKNIKKLPWYVLASPFFSKMNDAEDSSFEFYAKKYYKYKPVKDSNIFNSILKNLLMAGFTFFKVVVNCKFFGGERRNINSDTLIVDYYINKKNNKTILAPLHSKYGSATLWIVGSKEGYDKTLLNYKFSEVLSFLSILILTIFNLPLWKIGFLNYILEVCRTFNSFYAFNYYLAGKDLLKGKVKNLHLLYEDQLRDRMLLRDNNLVNVIAYINTSLIHQWRPNKSFSISDIYIPNKFIFKDLNSQKINLKYKFLSNNVESLVDSEYFYQETNYKAKKEIIFGSEIEKFVLKNICLYFPNSSNISKELINLSNKLNTKYPNICIKNFFHPNLKNYQNTKNIKQFEQNINTDLVISSYRTNKGYELSKFGFKVIYFGSDFFSFYNPINEISKNIRFAENANILFYMINELIE